MNSRETHPRKELEHSLVLASKCVKFSGTKIELRSVAGPFGVAITFHVIQRRDDGPVRSDRRRCLHRKTFGEFRTNRARIDGHLTFVLKQRHHVARVRVKHRPA